MARPQCIGTFVLSIHVSPFGLLAHGRYYKLFKARDVSWAATQEMHDASHNWKITYTRLGIVNKQIHQNRK